MTDYISKSTVISADQAKSLPVPDLADHEVETVRGLVAVWASCLSGNARRSLYYDTEQVFQDLGIALPPQLKAAEFTLGWGTKAVRIPASRTVFEGIRVPGSTDALGVQQVFDQAQMDVLVSQSVTSAYTHGMSLVTVARGGPGEPDVQIYGHAAENCAALWDRRRRRLASAMTVTRMGKTRPDEMIVYTPEAVITLRWIDGAYRVIDYRLVRIGQVMAVPFVSNPQLRKPLGQSRITRPVRTIIDTSTRSYVRMEGNAEFYSTPQLALLGVAEEAFESATDVEKFRLAMDRILALTRDEEGDLPTLTQLTQASMSPHTEMIRTMAAAFASETSIPLSSMGVVSDQPASAEAIRAAEHELLIEVTQANRGFARTVEDIGRLALLVRDGLSQVPDEAWQMSARFLDPEFRSMSAQADAVQKLGSSMDKLVQYPVLLEKVFGPDDVERILVDHRRSQGMDMMRRLLDADGDTGGAPAQALAEGGESQPPESGATDRSDSVADE